MYKHLIALAAPCLVLSAGVPKEASEAVLTFQQAVASGDLQLLSSVAHFPIKSNEFPAIKNPAELKKRFAEVFPPKRKAGLQGQAPTALSKDAVSVFSKDESDPIQFIFQRYGKVYLWCSIDNVNE